MHGAVTGTEGPIFQAYFLASSQKARPPEAGDVGDSQLRANTPGIVERGADTFLISNSVQGYGQHQPGQKALRVPVAVWQTD
jgi:hypothetical protein